MNSSSDGFSLEADLGSALKAKGVDFIKFADLSSLPLTASRGFGKAILIGILLSKDYVASLYKVEQKDSDEFGEKEHKADALAEWTAEYLQNRGYNSFAQSEENNWQNGCFDSATKSSSLPHKTIAALAGLGWVGKNNLLVTQDYGCAFCMCTILTDAPIVVKNPPLVGSKCGDCYKCRQICPTNAITGNTWSKNSRREMLVDVFSCNCCLKCLLHCPWSVRYADKSV